MTKRFFKTAEIIAQKQGYGVRLDSHELKTPAKNPLIVPSKALAALLVEEWNDCPDVIDTMRMPFNRLVNTALDRVPNHVEELADSFVAYGNNDLLCYRADNPAALVTRQTDLWNPILAWCAQRYDIHFILSTDAGSAGTIGGGGLQPITQSAQTLERVREIYLTSPQNSLKLSGLSHITALLGSAVLALALANKSITAAQAYEAAFIEELFQLERWGADADAEMRLDGLKAEINQVSVFFSVLD